MALEDTLDFDAFIYARLTASTDMQALFGVPDPSGVRAYGYVAPMHAAHPMILYGCQDAPDVNAMGGHRVAMWPCYWVRAVGRDSGFFALKPFTDLIDHLLQQQGNVLGASGHNYIAKFVRQSAQQYPVVYDNVTYYHMGGLYKAMQSINPTDVVSGWQSP